MTGYVSLCDTQHGPPDQACDVNAWRSADGTYAVQIRSSRPTDDVPAFRIDILMQKVKTQADWDTFFETERRRRAIVAGSPMAPIDHAKAGTVQTFGSLRELRAALVELKAERIWVPDRVFRFIDEQDDLLAETALN